MSDSVRYTIDYTVQVGEHAPEYHRLHIAEGTVEQAVAAGKRRLLARYTFPGQPERGPDLTITHVLISSGPEGSTQEGYGPAR